MARTVLPLLSVVGALALLGGNASAHHSVAGQFDQAQRVTITGVISKVEWINPHVYIQMDVPDEKGAITTWRLESLPTAMLRKAGLTSELLKGGVRLFEYRPSMTHAKVLVVDETWGVLGTTNLDNRSFEHNDEVNLALKSPEVMTRLLRDFEADFAASDEVTIDVWRQRPFLEKLVGPVCWILERQQ